MNKFTQHTGIALPLLGNNIDTDQIIPSREMKKVSKLGLEDGLFSGQRYIYDGAKKVGENPDFILNQPSYRQSTILLGGANFGCGSSREHAVWALKEYGFKIIIAESFGNIFHNNCIRNNLLPVILPSKDIKAIVQELKAEGSDKTLTVDLEQCIIYSTYSTHHYPFSIEEYCQEMLLNGWDFIDLALQKSKEIDTYIGSDRTQRSWAYLS